MALRNSWFISRFMIRFPSRGTGQRGAAVAVGWNDLVSTSLEPSNPYISSVGLNPYPASRKPGFLVACIYPWLPGGRGAVVPACKEWRTAIQLVREVCTRMCTRFQNTPKLIGGDFNCGIPALAKMLLSWVGTSFTFAPVAC